MNTDSLYTFVTVSRGGTVSVNKDLTREEVRRAYELTDEWYGIRHEIWFCVETQETHSAGGGLTLQDGDIVRREVIGPDGWNDPPVPCWPIREIQKVERVEDLPVWFRSTHTRPR